ncbi:MAG: hypothetical protein GX801_05770 [Fibrobacter sp.]|nr:hypothetical protein [Fibrobacter sp.]
MTSTLIQFINHPGDLFRNTQAVKLPDPDTNLEEFLVLFLPYYQSDQQVALLNDLYLLFHKEFPDSEAEKLFKQENDISNDSDVLRKITALESQLKHKAYQNFYHLIREQKLAVYT